jgi:hypothetical protein
MFTEAPQLYIKGDKTPQPLIVAPIAAQPEPAPEKPRRLIPVEIVAQPAAADSTPAPTSLTKYYSSAPK